MTTKRMPTFTPIRIILASWMSVGWVACKPVEPGTTVFEIEDPTTVTLPVEREITDAQGRTIAARIVGKDAFELKIVRLSDSQPFSLPISSLSEADRAFAKRIAIAETDAASSSGGGPPYIANREKAIEALEKEVSALLIELTPMGKTFTRDRLQRELQEIRAEIAELRTDIADYQKDRGL